MDAHQKTIAQRGLDGACDNTMSFPESLRALAEAGFEGYPKRMSSIFRIA